MLIKLGSFRPQDHQTTGPPDHRTTGPQDHRLRATHAASEEGTVAEEFEEVGDEEGAEGEDE